MHRTFTTPLLNGFKVKYRGTQMLILAFAIIIAGCGAEDLIEQYTDIPDINLLPDAVGPGADFNINPYTNQDTSSPQVGTGSPHEQDTNTQQYDTNAPPPDTGNPVDTSVFNPNEDKDGDGYTVGQGDCDDIDPAIHPGVAEIPDNNKDDNCDGIVDSGTMGDNDNDGYTPEAGDCDDTNAFINPAAKELCGDGIDNNCNGLIDDQEADLDGDGYSVCQGDCNETSIGVGPGAIEDSEDGVDNDCDGITDEGQDPCTCPSSGSGSTAMELAAAMDLCNHIVSSNVDGPSNAVGVYNKFGNAVMPLKGDCFLMLSTGEAASTSPQEGTDLGTSGTDPDPKGSGETVNDLIKFTMTMKAPHNAKGIKFDFMFLSAEYPEWVCTEYNDTFYAILTSQAVSPSPKNISFDKQGKEVTVNIGFFEPSTGWTTSLAGTGYDQPDLPMCMPTVCTPQNDCEMIIGSGTGWLTTTAPVTPGEIFTLSFTIHDEGDHVYDSTVIIDGWEWSAEPVEVETCNSKGCL